MQMLIRCLEMILNEYTILAMSSSVAVLCFSLTLVCKIMYVKCLLGIVMVFSNTYN